MPPDSSTRLEIDLELACATICLALLAAQFLHYRPSPLLTHGGSGMLIGGLLNAGLWATSLAMGQPATLSLVVSPMVHDIVYFALIPPIIFEAGFSMRKKGFFRNLVPILLFAVCGTLIATFSTGVILHALSEAGVIGTKLSLENAMLFASLISPTDPVSTLSVLRKLRAPPMLHDLIFGEATLNDALSIVLFKVISCVTAMCNGHV